MPNPLTKAGEEEAHGFFPFTEVFPIEGVIFIEGKYSVGFFCRPRGGGGDTCSLSQARCILRVCSLFFGDCVNYNHVASSASYKVSGRSGPIWGPIRWGYKAQNGPWDSPVCPSLCRAAIEMQILIIINLLAHKP